MTKQKDKTEKRPPAMSLVAFFAQSPLVGAGIDLERTPDYGREVDLDETD